MKTLNSPVKFMVYSIQKALKYAKIVVVGCREIKAGVHSP